MRPGDRLSVRQDSCSVQALAVSPEHPTDSQARARGDGGDQGVYPSRANMPKAEDAFAKLRKKQ